MSLHRRLSKGSLSFRIDRINCSTVLNEQLDNFKVPMTSGLAEIGSSASKGICISSVFEEEAAKLHVAPENGVAERSPVGRNISGWVYSALASI